MEKAKVPEERFERLRSEIADYEEIKGSILTGIEDYEKIEYQKKKILKFLNATEKEYDDYHWQIRNRFTTAESISKIIGLSENDLKYINEVATRYRFAVSPYYLSLTDPENPDCPIRRQAVPSAEELNDLGELDPMDEKGTAVREIITRRYPDRLINKNNQRMRDVLQVLPEAKAYRRDRQGRPAGKDPAGDRICAGKQRDP